MEHLEEIAAIEGRGDELLDLASSTELRIQPFLVRLTPFDLIIPLASCSYARACIYHCFLITSLTSLLRSFHHG